MAKAKHSTALFEVIHAGKGIQDRRGRQSILRTPTWWFKGKPDKAADVAAAAAGAPAATVAAVPPPFVQVADAPPATVAPVAAPSAPATPSIEPVPVDLGAAAEAEADQGGGAGAMACRTGVRVRLDPDRHEVTLRLRYTTAVVTGFAVLVALGLAYVTGRHLGRGPAPAYGSGGPPITRATDAVRRGKPNPGVMDVGRGAGASEKPAVTLGRETGTGAGPSAPSEWERRLTESGDGDPAGAVPADNAGRPRRQVGLNYVLIQSYREPKDAEEACTLLRQNGIDCSVEQKLRGFPGQWLSVVGTEGFTGISRQDYQAYVRKIQGVSDRKYAKQKSWKAFQPMPYKWGKEDPA